MPIQTPPFKILCLAPFHPDPERIWQGPPLPVDRFNIDEVIDQLQIRFFLPLDQHLCPAGGIALRFDTLKSMHPDGLAKSNAYLSRLLQLKEYLKNARRQGVGAARIREELRQWPDMPPIAILEDRPAGKAAAAAGALDNLLSMVDLPGSPSTPAEAIRDEVHQIDVIVQQILDTVFRNPGFSQMERAWGGLRLLLQQSTSQADSRVSAAAMQADSMEQSLESLTAHVINDLPNVVLLDLPFDHSPLAMQRLSAAAQWAATLMVPMVAWVPVDFFQIQSWRQLTTLPFLPHHLDTPLYAKFSKLKASDEGQWLCLTCNRILARFPYGKDNPPRQVVFKENEKPWISPVWALGALITQSAEQTGWPTRFTDIQQFQLLNLALHTPDDSDPAATEVLLARDRLDQLSRAGFTPLSSEQGRDLAFCPKAVTINGNSLAFQLLLSLTTQFILWCKDHLPAQLGPDELRHQLEEALRQFSARSKPPGFEKIAVSTDVANPEGRIPVHFVLTPHPSVLPGNQVIELRMDW